MLTGPSLDTQTGLHAGYARRQRGIDGVNLPSLLTPKADPQKHLGMLLMVDRDPISL